MKRIKKIGYILMIFQVFLSIGCNNVVRVKNNEKTQIIDSDISEPTNYKGIKNCEEGKEMARKEIEQGKIKYIFGGFGSRQKFPEKLKELYNIDIIKAEGLVGIPNECYNNVMYKEIQRKFGPDAFNKAME